MAGSSDFGSFGRYQEVPAGKMPPPMRAAYDDAMTLRGQVPGPHKIWLCNPTLSKTVMPVGAYYQTRSTLTKAKIEIATKLVNRQNSIDRVSLDPGDNSGFPDSVAGNPFDEELIGPCSGAWGRAPGEYGKVAYFISDGGTASPPPGGPRPAKLQRVVF